MMKAAAVAAALAGTAVAQEIVIQQSKPGIVDAGSIYFSGVTHRSATISWTEPDKGAWQWPILGYEIQVTSAVTWPEDTSCDTAEDTCVDQWSTLSLVVFALSFPAHQNVNFQKLNSIKFAHSSS